MSVQPDPTHSWVLRAPCGTPWGATMLATTAPKAWTALAGSKAEAATLAATGWTLERESNETAIPDVRMRLGTCVCHDADSRAGRRVAAQAAGKAEQ